MSTHTALGQTTRTIRIVNPFPAGGTADIVAHVLGEQIGHTRGVTLLVENRPGAATIIGTEAASRAVPDGNTLLITTPAFVVNPLLRKLNYDPLTSFEPICHLATSPNLIVVNSASPFRALSDLIDSARAKPSELTLAGVGPATAAYLAFERLKRATEIEMIFVPFAGTTPAVNAILGGHVTAASANYADMVEHLNAGTLRALATTALRRIAPLPDVPTVAESGYKEFEFEVWFGLFAPAKTPAEAVSRLATWFTAALKTPEVADKFLTVGLLPVGLCGAEFAAVIRSQVESYDRIIRDSYIQAE